MGIKVALEHRTSYTFDRLVEVHPHVVRLRPAPHSRTPIEAYSLQVEPADHFINWQQDAFGNFLARLVFPNRTRSLTITVGLIADMKVINPFDFFIEDWAEHIPFEYPKALAEDLKPYLRPVDEDDEDSEPWELTQAWVKNLFVAHGTRTTDFLVGLNRAVNADVGYSVRMEPGVRTGSSCGRHRFGRDLRGCWCRSCGIICGPLSVRVLSPVVLRCRGALTGRPGRPPTPPDSRLGGGGHPGRRLTAGPDVGAVRGGGTHPASATPHPASSAPITGATEPCETTLDPANIVTRVHEDPRSHVAPHRGGLGAICALGALVDQRLAAGDVWLIVCGEPTFVSIDNQVDPEWTTDADGPHKRQRASALTARLKKVWAPQGLIQHSQGKWYPGEPLPRWQIGLLWRTDGEPLWRDEKLLADPWPTKPETVAIAPDAGLQLLARSPKASGCPPRRCGRPTKTH
jgi:hypothetical protein